MKKCLLAAVLCVSFGVQAQWNEGQPVRLWNEDVFYPDYLIKASDTGYTWFLTNMIATASNGEASELFYAQGLDAEGKKLLGEYPMLLSDEYYQTFSLVEDNLFVDKDNNALYGVLDHRHDSEGTSVTIYKISPDGDMLWGDDGITIDGGNTTWMVVSLCGIQLEDGSYVFAWMASNENTYNTDIIIQRVTEDGEMVWEAGSVKLTSTNASYEYPHLENAGNNQFLLSYAYGASEDIEVMKYDFDGTPVWSEPTVVYNGSWGSTSLWLKINYAPSGDGGLLLTWYADPSFTNVENVYMQYVKPNGKLGFNVKNGVQLDYADYLRHLGVKGIYEPTTDSFIAVIEACDPNQVNYCIKAQRVSKTGELLWGEEAKEIVAYGPEILGYVSVQLGNPGEVAFFYEKATDRQGRVVSNHVMGYNVEECEELWSTVFGNQDSPKGSYKSVNAGSFWVAAWHENGINEDSYSSSTGDIYALRINYDGSGWKDSGICHPSTDNRGISYKAEAGKVTFDTDVTVYDMQGRTVAKGNCITLEPGIYIAMDEKGYKVKFNINR